MSKLVAVQVIQNDYVINKLILIVNKLVKMGIIEWAEGYVKKLKWYDIKLAQLAAIFATLTLITAWPAFLEAVQKLDWYWYLVLAVIFGIPLVKRIFSD